MRFGNKIGCEDVENATRAPLARFGSGFSLILGLDTGEKHDVLGRKHQRPTESIPASAQHLPVARLRPRLRVIGK